MQQEKEENMTLVASLTEEIDQLKVDLQDNIEKVGVFVVLSLKSINVKMSSISCPNYL